MFKFGGKNKGENSYSLFKAWLDGVLLGAGLPREVAAFNFNIYDGAQGGYDLELIGAPGFSPDDEDWACEELFASDLHSVPTAAAAGPAGNGSLEGIVGMVQRYLREGHGRQVLLDSRAVGVGHVSGAITLVHLAQPNEFLSDKLPPEEPTPAEAPAEEPKPAFYKLLRETRPRAMACTPKQAYGIRQYELLRGEPFDRWNDEFTFQYRAEKGDVPTDLLYNSMGWLLVSGRLRAALEEMGAEAEYFPVRVEEANSGKQQPGYWVANLLCKRDALCPEESECATVENELYGTYRLVKHYALRRDALAGTDIFKLSNHQEIPVFVTGRFKKRMEDAGFTGLAYFPVRLV